MSLINKIDQLRAASSINISNVLKNWAPYIHEAEETFIRPVLGDDFFDELDEAANSSGSDESVYEDLLTKIRMALALYAMYLGTDEMSMSVSSAGIQKISSETHKPAAEYEILNIKESYQQRAHRHIDLSLRYLADNRDKFPGYIPVNHGCFISNAADFNQYIDINSSRRVFLQLIPIMKTVEKKYIRPSISDDLFNELKEVMNGSGSTAMSEDQQKLVELIKPALAHLTMVRALQEITIDLLNWGSFQFAWSTFKSMQRMADVNKDSISMMLAAHQRDGESDMKELQEFLDNNATESKYTGFFHSSKYVGPASSKKRIDFINSADKSLFCP